MFRCFFILPCHRVRSLTDGLSFLSVFGKGRLPAANRCRTFPRKPEAASCRSQSSGAAGGQPFLQFLFSTPRQPHVRPLVFLSVVNSAAGSSGPGSISPDKAPGRTTAHCPGCPASCARACDSTGNGRRPPGSDEPRVFDGIRRRPLCRPNPSRSERNGHSVLYAVVLTPSSAVFLMHLSRARSFLAP